MDNMPSSDARVVLITGASGNLGTEVTEAFWKSGALIITVDRSGKGEPRERVIRVAADLTTADGAAKAAAAAQRIDVVLHLAGGFAGGVPTGETTEETFDHLVKLNLKAAFLLFRAVLPKMADRGHGRLIAVGAQAASKGVAGLSAYNASKAGLTALVQTVASEYKDRGVTANIVLPAAIDTPEKARQIAAMMLYLSSDEASGVTGAAIPIGG